MIDQAELRDSARRFGVPVEQIERDHFISHVLAALGSAFVPERDEFVFFGGTALCRTWLPDLRLSEDIDLLVNAAELSTDLRRSISRGVRRDFLDHEWTRLGSEHGVDTWNITADKLIVKVQFVLWRHRWKGAIQTTAAPVELRYSDMPDTVEMMVPTASGFAAMKLAAWLDRFAPRDIYDLAALAEAGHLGDEAIEAFTRINGYKPTVLAVGTAGTKRAKGEWETELGHQLSSPMSLDDCVKIVCEALAT